MFNFFCKLDKRAQSKEKIVPPSPLPYVSRRALAKVKDVIKPPTECRYCTHPVALMNNSVVYCREYGDWPYLYICVYCKAYVGLHRNTDLPLGILANAELRKLRKQGKELFIEIQLREHLTKDQAYKLLAGQLKIKKSKCHWGWFDDAQCKEAISKCQVLLASVCD